MRRLALENVTYRSALKEVSLTVDAGETVGVFAVRRPERARLLRVAAGIDLPEQGVVSTSGRIVFAQRSWHLMGGPDVLGQLMLPLVAQGSVKTARTNALAALAEWGIEDWSARHLYEMEEHELARLALIRAVAPKPDLLLVEDPTAGYGVALADQARQILHAARKQGCAVLLTASEVAPLVDADQVYTLSEGVMRGTPPRTAEVVEFPARTTA